VQIIKYTTEAEVQQIIAEKQGQGMVLVEVANITEGNFLGFKEPDEISSTISQRLDDMQNSIDLLLLKREGIIS
jgi:hypothetical protein